MGSTDGDSSLGRMARGLGRLGPGTLTCIVISSHTHMHRLILTPTQAYINTPIVTADMHPR